MLAGWLICIHTLLPHYTYIIPGPVFTWSILYKLSLSAKGHLLLSAVFWLRKFNWCQDADTLYFNLFGFPETQWNTWRFPSIYFPFILLSQDSSSDKGSQVLILQNTEESCHFVDHHWMIAVSNFNSSTEWGCDLQN